jgi:hypothetical protein
MYYGQRITNNNEDQSKFTVTRNHKLWVGASVQPPYPPDPTILGTSIQFFFSEAKIYMEGTILRNPGVSDSRRLSWGDKSHLEVTQE